jgi:hypothetical protein
MSHGRRILASSVLTALLVVGLLAAAHTPLAAANEVLTWNETAVKAAAAGG